MLLSYLCVARVARFIALVSAASSAVVAAAPRFPEVRVKRIGRLRSVGEDVPFPRRSDRTVIFAPAILEGKSREDGYLDLARSRDGRRLWTRRAHDDAVVERSLFTLKTGEAIPPDAVLQLVDGYATPAPTGRPGHLGSTAFTRGSEIWQQHFEAWLALPKARTIIRPADQSHYPLLPARGPYDEAAARKAMWVVFVPTCEELAGRPCVYYGAPGDACARSVRARQDDALFVLPHSCAPSE